MTMQNQILDITQILEPIRDELALVEARLRQPPLQEYDVLTLATQHLLSSGGKRIRPALAVLTSRLYQTNPDKIITLAAAVEMLHTATLVHDDLIDGSFLRRGIPTLNARWTPGVTIMAGDYMFARAAELASQTHNTRVMSVFAQTLMVICSGELKQLFQKDQASPSRQDYYERIEAKTAALFTCATETTAMLGDASEAQIRALHDYGRYLGLAFQIVDDTLDLTSDETTLGKPVGSDLAQGLVTLPTLYYLERHPPDAHDPVSAILNLAGHRPDPSALALAVKAIRQAGAIEASLAEARGLVQNSLEALKDLPDGPARQSLSDMAQFVVQRRT